MSFKAADGTFLLRHWERRSWERGISAEEPNAAIPIQYPFAPEMRVAEFRLECPTVYSPAHKLCRIVLTSGSHHLDARPQQRFLLPLRELLKGHRRTANEIHGKTHIDVEQS